MSEQAKGNGDVLVIGGTSSLAIPVIELLSSSGFKLSATFRNSSEPSVLHSKWFYLDVASMDSIAKFLGEIGQTEFDFILVFVGAPSKIQENPSDYVQTYLINLLSLCQSLSVRLKSTSISAMLHVSSRASIYPSRDILYSAVKGGMNSALRSLAGALPQESKIISVAPGLVLGSAMATDMPLEVRQDHMRRSKDQLMDVDEFASQLVGLMSEIKAVKSGSIVELGPSYS